MTEEPCEGYSRMLDELAKNIPPKKYMYKKSDVFNTDYYKENPDKIPSWLADEFDIVWIKYSEYIPEGSNALMPYNEFVSPLFQVEPEGKCDKVILWKGGKGIDIDLRHPLFSINNVVVGEI